jgi:hypothetical protein
MEKHMRGMSVLDTIHRTNFFKPRRVKDAGSGGGFPLCWGPRRGSFWAARQHDTWPGPTRSRAVCSFSKASCANCGVKDITVPRPHGRP